MSLSEFSDFVYGRELILLQKYSGELLELQEKLEKLGKIPKGAVYMKRSAKSYLTKDNIKHTYHNYNQELYIKGQRFHISKSTNVASEKELIRKYGKKYSSQDYSIKENILIAKNKIEQSLMLTDEIIWLKNNIKRLKNKINLSKNKWQFDISDSLITKLGKQYLDIKNQSAVYNRERKHKVQIAQTGTMSEIEAEFASETQRNFYLLDGKRIETYVGETVRSKNELIVANVMKRIGVLYMYEYFVQETGQNCDFYFLAGGKMCYLEVLGMMENEQYRRRWENKEKIYNRSGLRMGDKLFVINLSGNENIEERKIEKMFFDIAADNFSTEKGRSPQVR